MKRLMIAAALLLGGTLSSQAQLVLNPPSLFDFGTHRPSTSKNYIWQNHAWVLDEDQTISYNPQGKVSRYVSYRPAVLRTTETVIQYDAQGNIRQFLVYSVVPGTPNELEISVDYDLSFLPNGKVEESLTRTRIHGSSAFTMTARDKNEYNTAGQLTQLTSYDSTQAGWVPSLRHGATVYNAAGQLTSSEEETWNGSAWDLSHRYLYNRQGPKETVETQEYDGQQFIPATRSHETRKTDGVLERYETEEFDPTAFTWSPTLTQWYDLEYDARYGQLLRRTLYEKDPATGLTDTVAKWEYTYSPTTSLAGKNRLQGVELVPNPAKDRIRLQGLPASDEGAQIWLRDLSGKLLMHIPKHPAEQEVLLPAMAPGTYLLSIEHQGATHTQRLMIQP